MATRVIARIDDELARRLGQLRRRTGKTMSQLVKEGLAQLCDSEARRGTDACGRLRQWHRPFLKRLREAGFLACADGPERLSETYKELLGDALRSKT